VRRKQRHLPCPHVEELGDRILPAVASMPIISVPPILTPPIETPPVVLPSNPSAGANAAVIQQVNGSSDILVAGYDTIDGNQDFALWRFNSDGSLDTTFGNGGLVTTDFGPGSGTDMAQALALAIDPATGDIVLAGSAFNSTTSNLDFAVAVYNPDGTPNSNFGSNGASFGPAGTVTTDFGSGGDAQINALAIDPNTEQIVVAGYAYNGTTYNNDFALGRYNFDGSLDSAFGAAAGDSFGPAGTVTNEFGAWAQANALVIDSAGNYVVGGSAYNSTVGNNDFALARYNTTGDLDSSFGATSGSFGPAGTVTTDFGSGDAAINALTVSPSGEYLVAGSAFNGTTGNTDFALGLYNTDGSLDSSFGATSAIFGPAGTVTTDFGSGAAQINALTIDPSGEYVAAGNAFNSTTGYNDFALARYNADGSLDTTFGAAGSSFGPVGTITTDFGSGDAQVNALAIDANGDYVSIGVAFNSTTASESIALAGVDATGNLDRAFAAGNDGFGPTGTLTWQPAGTVPLPPPSSDGGDGGNGGVVLPPPVPVLFNGNVTPGDDGSGGPVSDGSVGPIGPIPQVLDFSADALPAASDVSTSSPAPSTAPDAGIEGPASTITDSHGHEIITTTQGPAAVTTTAETPGIAADIAFVPNEPHGAGNLVDIGSETLPETPAGIIPSFLSSAFLGQFATIIPPTVLGGTGEYQSDTAVLLPSSFDDSGTNPYDTPFAAPSAVKPAKSVTEPADSSTDDTTTPQSVPADDSADDGDDYSDE
jgi:uncharacterized delta-60 repeat protein